MIFLSPTFIFDFVIFLVGLVTIYTDLKENKIHNHHLGLGIILAAAGLLYSAFWSKASLPEHVMNGIIAFVIGYVFYYLELWKGGDAKLYALYALLMPGLPQGSPVVCAAIHLLACSFIIGSILLLPFLIKDIAVHSDSLRHFFSITTLFRTVRITILYSWGLFPLYYFGAKWHLPAFVLLTTFVVFNVAHHVFQKMDMEHHALYALRAVVILTGFFTRLWMDPHSLTPTVLIISLLKITAYSTFFTLLYRSLEFFKQRHERIAFAPLLFTGCVLSYTPFLALILHSTTR